jgi:hypothetical protein
MRGTWLGIVAVFAVGCSGVGVTGTDQAEHLAPRPDPCVVGTCDPGINKPYQELDPQQIASDFGRPELGGLVAARIESLKAAGRTVTVDILFHDLEQLEALGR